MRLFAAITACLAALGAAVPGQAADTRGINVSVKDSSGSAVALYAQSHALVVGVSEYDNGWPKLKGVKDDVPAVRAALEKQGFAVTVVMDPDRDGLDRAFREFVNRHGGAPDNRLLFYFAGHGHSMKLGYGGMMGYLVGRDAPNPHKDKMGFKSRALSMEVVETYARNIESKHALFLFDSCFSGSIFDATRAIPDIIQAKTGKPVRQFITSGAADQQVPDKSIFRRQFIEALNGEGDQNGDGYVTGSELGNYLEAQVTNYSRRSQTPQYGKLRDPLLDKGDFVFISPRGGAPKPQAAPSSPPKDKDRSAEIVFWQSIQNSANPASFQAYLSQYPNGAFAALAKLKIEELGRSKKTAPPKPAVPSYSVTPLKRTMFAAKAANVRAAPFVTAKKIGGLKRPSKVTVQGVAEVGGERWFQVALADGRGGFVHSRLLSGAFPVDTETVTQAWTGGAYTPIAGNPVGDVTIVEFCDYTEPYCRKAQKTIKTLLRKDGNIRLVRRPWPIFGDKAEAVARADLAMWTLDQSRYPDFHDIVMEGAKAPDLSRLLSLAEADGVDRKALVRAMDAPGVERALARNKTLVTALGGHGSPFYLVGKTTVTGARSFAHFRRTVEKERRAAIPKKQPDISTHMIREGEGRAAQPGDTVHIHYTLWLMDGTKVDSSRDRGRPMKFVLGAGQVIKGMDRGLLLAKPGSKRRLIIQPGFAYGKRGQGNTIPPNAVLKFEVETVRVEAGK